ncbi:hypothetical protein RRG08_061140 [Elysia crispata]|uniref:Uncharacterized protein n=1 Tax=Elysia crispata TaxID=231223 RepID=A0AAE0XDP5_9GAST|nr:hypothetical protein RRG08_061140 [Elysia crispata]
MFSPEQQHLRQDQVKTERCSGRNRPRLLPVWSRGDLTSRPTKHGEGKTLFWREIVPPAEAGTHSHLGAVSMWTDRQPPDTEINAPPTKPPTPIQSDGKEQLSKFSS